jgi:hypothetical protein
LRLIQGTVHPQKQGVTSNHRQQRGGLQPQPQGAARIADCVQPCPDLRALLGKL